MGIDSFQRDPLSRRRFLQTSGVGIAGGSATFLAACGHDDSGGNDADAQRAEVDVEILNGALDLELMSVAAYIKGAARLKGDVLQIVKGFLEQEQAHVDALVKAIRDADLRAARERFDSRWRATIEAPATFDYHGYTVAKTGPWGQGPVMLQQLALLKGFDLDGADPTSADFIHTVVEASKLAFADR